MKTATVALAMLALACTGTDSSRLGITGFEIRESPQRTTVVGRDAAGREVGRLELVRGRFTPSGIFAEDHEGVVDGRTLEIRVLDQTLRWETEGFAPALALPPHPPGQWAIADFVEDEVVAPVLARWGIGFARAPGRRSEGYRCDLEGTHPVECSRETTCQTLAGGVEPALPPPGTCGRTVAASYAWTVHQRASAGYHWDADDPEEVPHDQSFIAQCCPDFYAKKSCPDSRACTVEAPCKTTCGDVTVPGRCVGCPTYASNGKCAMRVEYAGWKDKDAPGGKAKVYSVCARFGWSCGDGICDLDEDCASCVADCGCHGDNLCVAGGDGEKPRCCEEGVCDD
jgi:hypothetical protein